MIRTALVKIQTVLYILLFVVILCVSAILLLPKWWYVWLLIVIVELVLLVGQHNRYYEYSCLDCGGIFEISALTNFISPHGIDSEGGWKLLKCLQCGNRSKKRLVVKKTKTDGIK
ncbi:hypothetical protein BVY01_02430 [bacterium I07]|nr:hypothetical protein BVY01_02430 [bacterium I07]